MAEICGTKRQLSVKDEEEKEEGETKKLKKEEEQLVMTGLSDVQIKERMGELVGEPKDEDLGQVSNCKSKFTINSFKLFSARLTGRRWQSTKEQGIRRRILQ